MLPPASPLTFLRCLLLRFLGSSLEPGFGLFASPCELDFASASVFFFFLGLLNLSISILPWIFRPLNSGAFVGISFGALFSSFESAFGDSTTGVSLIGLAFCLGVGVSFFNLGSTFFSSLIFDFSSSVFSTTFCSSFFFSSTIAAFSTFLTSIFLTSSFGVSFFSGVSSALDSGAGFASVLGGGVGAGAGCSLATGVGSTSFLTTSGAFCLGSSCFGVDLGSGLSFSCLDFNRLPKSILPKTFRRGVSFFSSFASF